MKWAYSVFKFFASLKVAVILIVLLGIAFGTGTFIESYHGAAAAQALVYRTNWLVFLLVFLALNLLASALDRIPWKIKHIGFLTTHLGIILMLMGALVTQAFGIEGQVPIQEGRTESRMTLASPLLEVISEDSNDRWIFPMRAHVFPWTGRQKLHSEFATPFNISLLVDYPKAKRDEKVQTIQKGSPAIHVSLKGSMALVSEWLFLEDPEKNSAELGPAAIRFSETPFEIPKAETNQWGKLRFNFENGKAIEIPLDSKSIGKTFPLKGTSYQISVRQIFKDALVEGTELVEHSSEWQNPAVQLMLGGGGLSERHTVFAKFPEFPTLHGMRPSDAHVRIVYDHPGAFPTAGKNEIRFIYRENRLPDYQVKKGNEIKEGIVELNKEVETGWMDFKFTVDSYLEQASVRSSYTPLPSASGNEEALPVVQIEFGKGNETKTLWLPQGEVATVPVGSSEYHVVYGLETKPLGFQIELKDFMMDTDPGTERPASFKSKVFLKDPMRGINEEHLIQMNQPLKYKGFKVYQSAYRVEPGKPDISIFTAARDPGNPLKYAGAVIMVLGILMLFYTKRFSTLKSSDPKVRSK